MAEAQLSVELTAKIDAFRKGMEDAVTVTKDTGKSLTELTKNISSNVAAFNKPLLDKFVSSLRDSKSVMTEVSVASSVLSKNISSNLLAFDKKPVDNFIISLNTYKAKLSEVAEGSSKSSKRVSDDLAKIAAASAKAGQGISVGSNQAAFALTNLGRVAQDAPFGFIGIQNNLNPLLESFQRLRQESGSNAAAIKALGASFIGPAGLGVALSLITSAITFYTMYQQKHNKVIKESKEDADAYLNSLDQISQAQLKGAENALKEQTELKILYDITQNTTLSLKQRTEAVNGLQEKYPAYFKNIKDENILNGLAKNAYDNLSASILATARARAAEDLITKNSSRQLENESKSKDLQVKIDRERLELAQRISRAETQQRSGIAAGSAGVGAAQGQGVAAIRAAGEERINKLITEQNKYKTDTNILNGRNLDLEKNIVEQIQKGADLTGKVGGIDTPKRAKDIKTLSDVLKELNIDLIQAANNSTGTFGDQQKEKVNSYQKAIDELIKLGFKPANAAILKLKESQKSLFDKDAMGGNLLGNPTDLGLEKLTSPEPILVQPTLKLVPIITGLTEAEKSMQKLGEDFAALTQSSISGAISGATSAIGEALASGNNVIEALGKSLLQSFGGFLSELGRLLVAYGTAALVKAQLDASLAIPGAAIITGPAAIAAGIALSIAGSAIGSFASGKGQNNRQGTSYQQPTAFANGGIIYGPTLGLMGEYAGAKSDPEVVAPLSKLKSILGQSEDSTLGAASSMGVNGDNVFNNTTNSYNGGSNQPTINVQAPQPIVIVPSFKMSGRDMYLMFKQEEQRQKRI